MKMPPRHKNDQDVTCVLLSTPFKLLTSFHPSLLLSCLSYISLPHQISSSAMQDIEDWGAVTVNEKCTGCMTCRVLSPDIFLETKPESKSKVRGREVVHIVIAACSAETTIFYHRLCSSFYTLLCLQNLCI